MSSRIAVSRHNTYSELLIRTRPLLSRPILLSLAGYLSCRIRTTNAQTLPKKDKPYAKVSGMVRIVYHRYSMIDTMSFPKKLYEPGSATNWKLGTKYSSTSENATNKVADDVLKKIG